jgi:predicted CoA-binding protein
MSTLTLVIGASENPQRYSNMAIRKLKQHGHRIAAIGNRDGMVDGIPFSKEKKSFSDIDTVTMYIGKQHQAAYIDYIISLKPRRIIFNPGTENAEFEEKAAAAGIQTLEACTLVMLGTGQY